MDPTLFSEFTDNDASQDKENKYYTEYVDVKSEGLQDVLYEIFKDVDGVSLREDKPSVSRSFAVSEGGRTFFVHPNFSFRSIQLSYSPIYLS
jgi:hypothetical protein